MKKFILNFHGIGIPGDHVPADELPYWLRQSEFEKILDQIVGARRQLKVEITFDDGNFSDVDLALPALSNRGLSAAFFICAGRIGKPNFLAEDSILELADAGMTIGSHGLHHTDLRRCNNTELERELTQSKEVIEDVLGVAVQEIGIPFGSYDRRVLSAIKKVGYKQAYTSDGGMAAEGAFLKPRNTIQNAGYENDVFELIQDSEKLGKRVKRTAATLLKKLR